MRFLFGLILGAVLTLCVATAFNVPTRVLVDQAITSLDDFLTVAGNTPFKTPKRLATDLDVGEIFEMTALDVEADSVEHPTPSSALAPPTSEPMDLDALLAGPATTTALEPEALEPAAPATTVTVDHDLPTQAVWVPFRSQMSAQGFARRLTGKLDHPFRVDRQGPGRYQVLFSYASELDRLDVLDQVSFLTGERKQ
jgi:hypothetical protein